MPFFFPSPACGRVPLLLPLPLALIFTHKYSAHKEAGGFSIEFMTEVSAH